MTTCRTWVFGGVGSGGCRLLDDADAEVERACTDAGFAEDVGTLRRPAFE